MVKLILSGLMVWMFNSTVAAAEPPTDFDKYWPQWRGPYANGVAPHANPPVQWDEANNVKWKIELPGKGHATPIIWDSQIFVLTAIETPQQGASAAIEDAPSEGGRRGPPTVDTDKVHNFAILALNRYDGSLLWQKDLREELPHEGTHPTGSWASNSPVTDGERVYAYFGSRGLYCLDMDGALLWEKDLGDMTIKLNFGEGSSPVLHGDKLVINWDHEGDSFIVALDKHSGRELWRTARDEATSWATPLVVEHSGKAQVVTSATSKVRSYDLESGELLWETSGMTSNAIPSPVSSNGTVFLTSGFRGNALLAIQLARARGDITGSDAILWSLDRDTPYTPSPLLYDNSLYFLKSNNGIISCFDANTGTALYGPQRLEGIEGVYASPVAAGDRVYIVGRNGASVVLKHGQAFELLAQNKLDDGFDASPAIVDSELYLRGNRFLYCIADE